MKRRKTKKTKTKKNKQSTNQRIKHMNQPVLQTTMEILINNKGTLYQHKQIGAWAASIKAPFKVIDGEPRNRWSGAKIPAALWKQALAFMEWSQHETKAESLLHFLYHDGANQWTALVLPQEGYNGMTVKLLDDHENKLLAFQTLPQLPAGTWEIMGTLHHHCSAGAFQSGTDSNDEKSKEGIHITVGNMGSQQYSIHARTSFRGEMHDAVLADWFEMDTAGIPDTVIDTVLKYRLTQPTGVDWTADNLDAAPPFPLWWKDNVIKVERALSVYGGSTQGFQTGYYQGGQWIPFKNSGDSHKPYQSPQGKGKQSYHQGFRTIFERESDLVQDLTESAAILALGEDELLAALNFFSQNSDLIEAITTNGFEPADALELMAKECGWTITKEAVSPTTPPAMTEEQEEAWDMHSAHSGMWPNDER